MRVLIIDNFDSFTYNLYQQIGSLLQERYSDRRSEINVKRNNEVTLEQVEEYSPDRIIISPGPGSPADEKYFGVCSDIILHLGKITPILGVCLGMQGIAYCYGGEVVRAPLPMHGKLSLVQHDGKGVFKNIPQSVEVMRYHSLIVDPATLPDCFEITSIIQPEITMNDVPFDVSSIIANGHAIMGIRHKFYPIEGVQFHPESFASEGGKQLICNFLFAE